MLDRPLAECHCPIGRIVTYRCRNLETARQFGIDHHLGCRIEVVGELRLDTLPVRRIAVGEDIVLYRLFGTERLPVIILRLLLDEDVAIVGTLYPIVGNMVNHHIGFLLVDKIGALGNELLRVGGIHIERSGADTR